MSGNCHRKCPESVRVYMSVSGKCLFFVLKNDQAHYSDLFKCPEYVCAILKNKENVRNVYGIFEGIVFFIQKNVRNVYGIFGRIIFSYKKMSGMCTEFLEGSFFIQKMSGMCTETSLNINFDLF